MSPLGKDGWSRLGSVSLLFGNIIRGSISSRFIDIWLLVLPLDHRVLILLVLTDPCLIFLPFMSNLTGSLESTEWLALSSLRGSLLSTDCSYSIESLVYNLLLKISLYMRLVSLSCLILSTSILSSLSLSLWALIASFASFALIWHYSLS